MQKGRQITKTTFERQYCKRSNISLAQYRVYKITLPCACDSEGCQGWAAIPNDPDIIADHMQFYAPKGGV